MLQRKFYKKIIFEEQIFTNAKGKGGFGGLFYLLLF